LDTICLRSEKIFIIIIIKGNNQNITFLFFYFPTLVIDTPMVGQNFTTDLPPLLSMNCRFVLRLGKAYLMMHIEFYGWRAMSAYWKHTTLMEAVEQEDNMPTSVYGRLNNNIVVQSP
jgi:hypothetical protein